MTTTYFTASSLDGFIADPEESLSWLLSRDIDTAGSMGYDAFLAEVGALAMGAATYDWLRRHEQDWPTRCPAGCSATGSRRHHRVRTSGSRPPTSPRSTPR